MCSLAFSVPLDCSAFEGANQSPFLEHRFGTQEAQRIPPSGRDDLFERTQAAPALIDQVARHALARSKEIIDPEVIRAVLDTHGL